MHASVKEMYSYLLGDLCYFKEEVGFIQSVISPSIWMFWSQQEQTFCQRASLSIDEELSGGGGGLNSEIFFFYGWFSGYASIHSAIWWNWKCRWKISKNIYCCGLKTKKWLIKNSIIQIIFFLNETGLFKYKDPP